MANTGQFIGLKEANAALRRLPEFARPKVQAVMDRTGFRVMQGAVQRVRRSAHGSHGNPPGFLASQIAWQSRPQTLSAVAGVGPAAFYWKFLEYGTVHMDARPFFRPAADAERDTHQRELVAALEQAGDQVEAVGNVGGRFL